MQFLVIGRDGKDDHAFNCRMLPREAHVQLGNRMRDAGELPYAIAILDDAQKMIVQPCRAGPSFVK